MDEKNRAIAVAQTVKNRRNVRRHARAIGERRRDLAIASGTASRNGEIWTVSTIQATRVLCVA